MGEGTNTQKHSPNVNDCLDQDRSNALHNIHSKPCRVNNICLLTHKPEYVCKRTCRASSNTSSVTSFRLAGFRWNWLLLELARMTGVFRVRLSELQQRGKKARLEEANNTTNNVHETSSIRLN